MCRETISRTENSCGWLFIEEKCLSIRQRFTYTCFYSGVFSAILDNSDFHLYIYMTYKKLVSAIQVTFICGSTWNLIILFGQNLVEFVDAQNRFGLSRLKTPIFLKPQLFVKMLVLHKLKSKIRSSKDA